MCKIVVVDCTLQVHVVVCIKSSLMITKSYFVHHFAESDMDDEDDAPLSLMVCKLYIDVHRLNNKM